ncbi:unnamed protein product [Medioppia subpectinata]|uniref:Uncharacterized protein n=1 Tax=Medioppia subpectinata TaxID=1979941 RepID=A0A7R9Q560_9ACAR|nr:unnamed protein product [Medioppia subpectinata]CAG2113088.1 unnamed protein product [Medioppia subpectinata]
MIFYHSVIAEENPIDYGEQANTDAVQLRVYNLVLPIGTIMDAAEKRYKKQGLTVPIKLYDDVKEFAITTIPWIFEQFKAVTNESIKEFMTAEFPKLYKAIDKIPFEEAKQANLQVLIQDLSHAVIPPL